MSISIVIIMIGVLIIAAAVRHVLQQLKYRRRK